MAVSDCTNPLSICCTLLCERRLESLHNTSWEGSGETRSQRVWWPISATCASFKYWAGSWWMSGEERVKQSTFVGELAEFLEGEGGGSATWLIRTSNIQLLRLCGLDRCTFCLTPMVHMEQSSYRSLKERSNHANMPKFWLWSLNTSNYKQLFALMMDKHNRKRNGSANKYFTHHSLCSRAL